MCVFPECDPHSVVSIPACLSFFGYSSKVCGSLILGISLPSCSFEFVIMGMMFKSKPSLMSKIAKRPAGFQGLVKRVTKRSLKKLPLTPDGGVALWKGYGADTEKVFMTASKSRVSVVPKKNGNDKRVVDIGSQTYRSALAMNQAERAFAEVCKKRRPDDEFAIALKEFKRAQMIHRYATYW